MIALFLSFTSLFILSRLGDNVYLRFGVNYAVIVLLKWLEMLFDTQYLDHKAVNR